MLKSFVRINDVTLRDGIQSLKNFIPTRIKIKLINLLTQSNLKYIEVGTLGVDKRVPQFSDSSKVYNVITKKQDVKYPFLIFNHKGIHDANNLHVNTLAFVTSPSEGFSKANMNKSVSKTITLNNSLIKQNIGYNRLYISTSFSCPIEKRIIGNHELIQHIKQYDAKLIDEFVLSDTEGKLTPMQLETTLDSMNIMNIPKDKITLHLHENQYSEYNINIALIKGIRSFDSSLSNSGGCIIMNENHKNISTLDLIKYLKDYETNITVDYLLQAQRILMLASYV